MNRSENWNLTGRFLVSFLLFTILALIILWGILAFTFPGVLEMSFPQGPVSSTEDVNWKMVQGLKGWGEVLDEEGEVLSVIGAASETTVHYTAQDLSLFTSNRENDYTRLAYPMPDHQTLILVIPKQFVTTVPTLDLGAVGNNQGFLNLIFLAWFGIYLFVAFLLANRLQKKVARELNTRHRAEEEERMQIFRGLAHDIKTPLATIMAYTKALVDGITPVEERGEFLSTIYRQGEILSSRVTGLLTITSLDATGKLGDRGEGNILKETRQVIEDLSSFFDREGAEVFLDPSLNGEVLADIYPSLWRRCVENILTNAVNHNDRGVKIHLSWNPDHQELIIDDDGKGIPKEKRKSILAPFIKGDEARTDLRLSGIGLYTTTKMLEKMDWTLQLEDNAEGGLRVIFRRNIQDPEE